MHFRLPRYVIGKRLANGDVAFYFNIPSYFRKLGCPIPREPLGTDYEVACGKSGDGGRAASLNARFDEWNQIRRGQPVSGEREPRYGTVDWLFREYKKSKAYTEKVSPRSRRDYERTMLLITDTQTKKGDRIGSRMIKAISPRATDKIYELIIVGPRGERLRQGEKAVALCRKAWRVVYRLYPHEFDRNVPNPWEGVTLKTRVQNEEASGYARRGLSLRLGLHRSWEGGSGGCGCDMLRMASASGERVSRPYKLVRLPERAMAECHKDFSPQNG